MSLEKQIGFHAPDPGTVEKTIATIENVDSSFAQLLKDIAFEDETAKKQLAVDADLREAMIRLHKNVLGIRDLASRHQALVARYNGLMDQDPRQAARILDEIEHFENEFIPKYQEVFKDLNSHVLPDLDAKADILRNRVLSGDSLAHYRSITIALQSLLGAVSNPVMQSFNGRYIENTRRSLVSQHPDLR